MLYNSKTLKRRPKNSRANEEAKSCINAKCIKPNALIQSTADEVKEE